MAARMRDAVTDLKNESCDRTRGHLGRAPSLVDLLSNELVTREQFDNTPSMQLLDRELVQILSHIIESSVSKGGSEVVVPSTIKASKWRVVDELNRMLSSCAARSCGNQGRDDYAPQARYRR